MAETVIIHYGYIKDGKKHYHNPELYRQQIIALEGHEFMEQIQQVHIRPTKDQHEFYRGVVLPVAHKAECFNHYSSKDELHKKYFAPKYLGYTKVIDGKEKEYVMSTSAISRKQMSEFIERVLAELTELGIEIPEPDQAHHKYY